MGFISKDHLENIDDVPLSVMDWRTRAAKRVFHATFAAESQAGVDTVGIAKYLWAYWCDVMFGFADWVDVTEYGEEQLPIVLYTDCKSLYDHLRKDGAVPDDKWIAVAIASQMCCISRTGTQSNEVGMQVDCQSLAVGGLPDKTRAW